MILFNDSDIYMCNYTDNNTYTSCKSLCELKRRLQNEAFRKFGKSESGLIDVLVTIS